MPRTAVQVSDRSLRPERSAERRRTAAIALASNLTIAAAKIVAGVAEHLRQATGGFRAD